MDDSRINVDPDLHARLLVATEAGGGTATWPILKTLDTGKTYATPGKQPKQSRVEFDAPHGISSGTRKRVETCDRHVGVNSDDDESSTFTRPAKRARFINPTKWDPKNELPANYNYAPQQPVPQHPAPQLPAPQHLAVQHLASSTQQTQPALHWNSSLEAQATSSVPVQDVREQSRQLHRILLCPTDAYFDILSLANGTDLCDLVEASWLHLSFLLHPRICPMPDATKALSRVNDAYAWIQKHPGLAQPHVSPQPIPHVAQNTLRTPRAFSPSYPRVDTVSKPQQPYDSSGTQPHFAPQQPESGPAPVLDPPPPRTFGPRPSSHIYAKNGKPTIRPVVGWQFREHGGETRVWHQGRWRSLIQNRPEFEGLRVDEGGWIMPIMNCTFNENQWKKVQGQAKLEFNSHT